MGERNRYGLGRYVPEDVRREVRQRCGFGCVICGLAYYDYEHFDPDFKDAKEHCPNGMTLLCMQCNQKRARGTLSVESVSRANKNPKCRQAGFSSETFDFGVDPIWVSFASTEFYNCNILIQVRGFPILSVAPPQAVGEPFLLSGLFSDSTGACTLKIENNVWSVGSDNWDVECVGRKIIIRRGVGDIALSILLEPPGRLLIQKINIEFDGVFLRGDDKALEVSFDGVSWGVFSANAMHNCSVGISIG